MSGPIKKLVEKAGKVESLWALWNLVKEAFGTPLNWVITALLASWGGLMTWLGKQTTLLGEIGWPEAVLFGIGATAVLALLVCAALALYRYFRPLPTPEAPPATPVTENHLQAVHSQLDYQKDILDRLGDDVEKIQRAVFDSKTIIAGSGENRVERLEKFTEHLRERMNSAAAHIEKLVAASPDVNLDLAHLLSFAVDEATVAMLDGMMAEAPASPIPLDAAKNDREEDYKRATNYVHVVTSAFGDSLRGVKTRAIANAAIHDGEREAERTIKEMAEAGETVPSDRVFDIRRYKIADLQCRRLKAFLFRERAEVAERAAYKRDDLIERLSRRNPS